MKGIATISRDAANRLHGRARDDMSGVLSEESEVALLAARIIAEAVLLGAAEICDRLNAIGGTKPIFIENWPKK